MFVDAADNLFIADQRNHRVRKVDPAGTISTLAGPDTAGFTGDGGPATAAQLGFPAGVYGDSRLRLWRARRGAPAPVPCAMGSPPGASVPGRPHEVYACAGLMKVTAALTESAAIRKYLDPVGLPSRAPPICAAPQRHLEFHEAA